MNPEVLAEAGWPAKLTENAKRQAEAAAVTKAAADQMSIKNELSSVSPSTAVVGDREKSTPMMQ